MPYYAVVSETVPSVLIVLEMMANCLMRGRTSGDGVADRITFLWTEPLGLSSADAAQVLTMTEAEKAVSTTIASRGVTRA